MKPIIHKPLTPAERHALAPRGASQHGPGDRVPRVIVARYLKRLKIALTNGNAHQAQAIVYEFEVCEEERAIELRKQRSHEPRELSAHLSTLGMPQRTVGMLDHVGILTLGQLLDTPRAFLFAIPYFSHRTIGIVFEACAAAGYARAAGSRWVLLRGGKKTKEEPKL